MNIEQLAEAAKLVEQLKDVQKAIEFIQNKIDALLHSKTSSYITISDDLFENTSIEVDIPVSLAHSSLCIMLSEIKSRLKQMGVDITNLTTQTTNPSPYSPQTTFDTADLDGQ